MAKSEINSMIKDVLTRLVDPPLVRIEQNFSRTRESILGELSAIQALLNEPARTVVYEQTIQEISDLAGRQMEEQREETEARLGSRLSDLALNGQKILTGNSQAEILDALLSAAALFAGRVILFLSRGEMLVGWRGAGPAYCSDHSSLAALQISKTDEGNLISEAFNQQSAVQRDFSTSMHAFINLLGGRSPEQTAAIPLLVAGKCPAVLFADHHPSDAIPFHHQALVFLSALTQAKIELHTLSRTVQKVGKMAPSYIDTAPLPSKAPAATMAVDEPIPEPPLEPATVLVPEAVIVSPTEVISKVVPESAFSPSWEPIPLAGMEPSFPPQTQDLAPEAEIIPSVQPIPDKDQTLHFPFSTIAEPSEEVGVIEEPLMAIPAVEPIPPPVESLHAVSAEPQETIPVISSPVAEPESTPVFSFTPEDMKTGQFKMSLMDLLSQGKVEVPSTPPPPTMESIPPAVAVPEPAIPSIEESASSFIAGLQIPSPTVPLSPPTSQAGSSADRLHSDARRFARLLVSEIKLYNETALIESRKSRNIYTRLKKAIDLSREHYSKRIAQSGTPSVDYFHEELVRMLCDGDITLLGKDYPGPAAIHS